MGITYMIMYMVWNAVMVRRNRPLTPNIVQCDDWTKIHNDVIKWKHFPRYWPFVRGIHRSPGISPHKRQWALMFSLNSAWINGWVNNREAGDLRRHRAHCDVIVTIWIRISNPGQVILRWSYRKSTVGIWKNTLPYHMTNSFVGTHTHKVACGFVWSVMTSWHRNVSVLVAFVTVPTSHRWISLKMPVKQSFIIIFVVNLNKLLKNKQSSCR